MNSTILLIAFISTIPGAILLFLFIRKSNSYKRIYNRFKDVIDIEKEKEKIQSKYKKMVDQFRKTQAEIKNQETQLRDNYKAKRGIYENLLKEISVLEENLDFISYGVYKPHFEFDSSEEYKIKMIQIREQQREMIRDKKAALCHTEWAVEGSKAEGRKMTNRNLKLILRAFNNECESAILKVKWNNVEKMEERINKAYDSLNKLGEPNHIEISWDYYQLKLNELYLAHEYQEKLYEEKEEQRRHRTEMREEEKVRREIEKAKKEAEDEEKRYQNSLELARQEISLAQGEELTKLNEQLKILEEKLKEAQDKKERAISRAEQTKSGHVYIISNIGSFGNRIYKIGMTRRLDPIDRVKELGDASVPFGFDVHAMIYSDNAPTLESNLHNIFKKRRVNLVNFRREYFFANLDEIEKVIKNLPGENHFTKLAEAKEYRESIVIRDKAKIEKQRQEEVEKKFPQTI
jgi:hypothetical protein